MKNRNPDDSRPDTSEDALREQRRLRLRRHGRRAYIRSIYLLPSMMTLGNAICGFAAIYVASLTSGSDPWTQAFIKHRFVVAAYLIFLAMVCDALDGRLARFTRHTTDFGGQLDSMADVISFGVAPAILMLQLCKDASPETPHAVTRAIWGIGAVYACCAAIRLARFNVSNEHGEQHHFSFLGLPSPGAGGTIAAIVLMNQAAGQEYLALPIAAREGTTGNLLMGIATIAFWALPIITLITGLLMVSTIRYPHIINRYLRGRKTVGQLVLMLVGLIVLIAWHQYMIAVAAIVFTASGMVSWVWFRINRRRPAPKQNPTLSQ